MKKLVVTAFILMATVSFAQQKATKDDVLKMLDKMGTNASMKAATKQILPMIPEAKKGAFLLEFEGVINKIKDKTADIYLEEYTAEDVKNILAFYETPAGKKITEKAGLITEKSQTATMEIQGEIQAMMMKYAQ